MTYDRRGSAGGFRLLTLADKSPRSRAARHGMHSMSLFHDLRLRGGSGNSGGRAWSPLLFSWTFTLQLGQVYLGTSTPSTSGHAIYIRTHLQSFRAGVTILQYEMLLLKLLPLTPPPKKTALLCYDGYNHSTSTSIRTGRQVDTTLIQQTQSAALAHPLLLHLSPRPP
jgi:hypothetical protein